ncbi:putative amino acid permease [Tilletiaria anomala UBC 951]|uniref:Putative amino acid permease n=1 Tax=Tilletiaria anomala (strain ATCC 24038 / CBS 436.72 / UBC 951) TaxID=1037660 RepID=A0A066VHE9_TILAU|nr:putative amino acid permease [Tilletiaria anomala UBC 951]KDN40886.1 putative amino acid permease [Tilletiaria anomala UBC 951]
MPTTTDESGLKRNLTQRHMQMIAFGGAIGTGLFVGSGGVYTTGGPGFLVLDYILVGIMLFCVVMSLGELASVLPVSGSFATYSTRFLSPSWGFAMGWNYWMQWYITLPLELVAASIVIRFWDPEQKITPGVWIIIFMIAIVIINLFGVRGYGEFEFGAALIKIMAVIGFIIAGIVISCGGGPSHEYIGAKFWHTEQGAFFNGFQGFCSVFVSASFAFSGTELIGLAAAETANPRKEVPKAAKQIFARILIFYCVSLFIVTLTVDPTDARLTGGSSNYDARQSPFVIAIDRAQIKALPSVINAVILVSVLSVGNSSVYAGSRTLLALAQAGQAPRIFSYIDRHGRPLPAVLLSLAIGFLAFLIYSTSQTDVFNWLLGLSGLSVIFSWASISFCHVRFRAAWKRAGHTLEELPWKSPIGIFGAWYGGLFCILVVILQMIIAVWPIGSEEMTTSARVVVFFQSCLALPVVILFYCIGEALWHDGWIQVEDIDISTGRREPVPVDILRREREEAKATPIYKQVWSLFF